MARHNAEQKKHLFAPHLGCELRGGAEWGCVGGWTELERRTIGLRQAWGKPNYLRAGDPHEMLAMGTSVGTGDKMPKMTLGCRWVGTLAP